LLIVDASSIIYGWDNYPLNKFPKMWEWISSEIKSGVLSILAIALTEVENVCLECSLWLKNQSIITFPVTNDVLLEALRISHLHGIKDGLYHAKGFDENDAIIMTTAAKLDAVLISNEDKQINPPREIKKTKIPRACSHQSVSIQCINFLDYIKSTNVVF
jgi:hypothetical protein